MDIFVRKTMDGALRPVSEEDAEALKRFKLGDPIKVKVTQPRNYKFLQKTMVLFGLAYEHFCEFGISEAEYQGRKVVPCKETFRKNLIVLAGHYDPVFDIRGKVRLVPHSLSFANCTEEKAQRIYNDVITAVLANVYRGNLTEEELNRRVAEVLAFA